MFKWILPSLKDIIAANQSTVIESTPAKAEQQWLISLVAAEQLLLDVIDTTSPDAIPGLVLAAPAPVFCHPTLTENLQTITFTAKPFNPLALMPFQMSITDSSTEPVNPHKPVLPLLPVDPLAKEQFCLVFTEKLRLVLVLTEENNGNKSFLFSFEPEVVEQAWRALAARIMLTNPDFCAELDELVQKYPQVTPDYRHVMYFSQMLLANLPEPAAETENKEQVEQVHVCENSPGSSPRVDVELLQAFAHEVRTPLATIRTMTRLLLKQRDLPARAIERLKKIDKECTEQIDRMELLFRAAELETTASVKSTNSQLTAMSLNQVLEQSIPRWQDAASRRNLTLDVVLPQQVPTVVSNPNMLDRVLTGLIENFTRNLPAGSHIQVQVIPAGNQLKLQLLPISYSEDSKDNNIRQEECAPPIRKAIGQLLMFQPETGAITLNLSATKHLFQAIGGKLIVRQRPQQGEVLTIFLPLEVKKEEMAAKN
ncbi:MAG: HAMP domain-containing sensor histidine kinase [Nostocaceae cyanobacterium]|nr:HAMP domain-containing sensor histidine kinase [Nostocaceae cyanobacterium]